MHSCKLVRTKQDFKSTLYKTCAQEIVIITIMLFLPLENLAESLTFQDVSMVEHYHQEAQQASLEYILENKYTK